MAKNPIWPCYFNDLRGSTQDWTDEEFGAYVRLLIFEWDKGGVPVEEKRRVKIAETSAKHWGLLKTKFEEKDGVLVNKKTIEVREKKKKHSEKQAENVEKRYQKATKKLPNDYQTDYQKPTKNIPLEIDIEKEKEKDIKGGVRGGEVQLPVNGFRAGPEKLTLVLPAEFIKSAIKKFKAAKDLIVSEERVLLLWESFKQEKFINKPYYASSEAVFTHFINSINFIKLESNGKSIKGAKQPGGGLSSTAVIEPGRAFNPAL